MTDRAEYVRPQLAADIYESTHDESVSDEERELDVFQREQRRLVMLRERRNRFLENLNENERRRVQSIWQAMHEGDIDE